MTKVCDVNCVNNKNVNNLKCIKIKITECYKLKKYFFKLSQIIALYNTISILKPSPACIIEKNYKKIQNEATILYQISLLVFIFTLSIIKII